jgi:hypothetical protein
MRSCGMDIELEENTERLDLEPYDRDKRRLAEIREAEADAKREAEFRGQGSRNSRRRPPEPGSHRDVEKRTGIPPTSQREIERSVNGGRCETVLSGEAGKPKPERAGSLVSLPSS